MKIDLYNLKNERIGEVEIPDEIFGVSWKPALVKQALLAQLANQRRPWAHAKGRGEVRGGGRKPWRQKGTGRARHGSIRSPLWPGGGKSHGPSKERDYSQKLNRKMRKLAMASILSKKLRDQELKMFESLDVEQSKTKAMFETLRTILNKTPRAKKLDVLLIPESQNQTIARASRNLVKTKVSKPEALNVYDLINHKYIFIDQKTIPVLQKYRSK